MSQGIIPKDGFGLQSAEWLTGLINGVNYTYANGISAAGSTQATATQLPGNTALVEIDTVGASQGVALPGAYAGTDFCIYNNTATTLTVYPQITNNLVTGVQDTINNTTSTTINAHVGGYFFCGKNGNWCSK